MANLNTVNVIIPFDGLNDGTRLGFQVPAALGGITVVAGNVHAEGTANVTLVTMTSAGTPAVSGTIAAAVGGTATDGVPYALTISDGWVDGGEWVAVQENNVGTPTRGHVALTYVQGRGAS